MTPLIIEYFVEETQLENLSDSYAPQSLRINSEGLYHLIDTTSRSTWKGRLISLIQCIFYGDKTKACDLAISKAVDQFEETLLKTARTAENVIHSIDMTCKKLAVFTSDPDFSHGTELKQKIEGFRIRVLEKLSDDGQLDAQEELGYCYENGIGVDRDEKKAVELYTQAANKGHATAQNNLGYRYQHGIGVNINYKEAIRLYILAAEKGHAAAEFNLGYCYENGIGVDIDVKKAVELYTLAAEKGDAIAQSDLGHCYENGIGVDKDIKKAVELYTLAAEQDDTIAQFDLGYCYENGIGVDIDEKKAVELYTLAAKKGHSEAKNALERLGITA